MQALHATEVRNSFSSVIDTAVREKPVIFKRNRDYLMLMSNSHVLGLLKNCEFHARYFKEDDGSITAELDDFDLVINAADDKEAQLELAKELIDYAQEYFDNFQFYYSSNNRNKHFPYVLRVLLAQDLDEVVGLINA